MVRTGVAATLVALLPALLNGCASVAYPNPSAPAVLTPRSATNALLRELPRPKGPIVAAVYGFRDQTGQYKPSATGSSFSTSVTQGATSMLIKALKDSGWFVPVEREGLQNLLTERKIIRAAEENGGITPGPLPPLRHATIVLEGGIIGYETNTLTGGLGAKYFGIGASTQYRSDQVTVYLRAVDARTGLVINSVSASKTIYSREVQAGVFRFVSLKRLLELETGYTTNEPAQQCVLEAIEKALLGLIVEGVLDRTWALGDPADINTPVIRSYVRELRGETDTLPVPDGWPLVGPG